MNQKLKNNFKYILGLIILIILMLKLVTSEFIKSKFIVSILDSLITNFYALSLLIYSVIVCALFIINRKSLISKIPNKKSIFILVLIIIFAVIIRLEYSPMYDPARSGGGEYMTSAKHFVLDHKYIMCHSGSFSNCEHIDNPPHSAGFPLLLSYTFMTFGMNDQIPIYFNIILGSLAIVLVFLLLKEFSKNKFIPFIGAFIFSILNNHVQYSGTPEVTIANSFFVGLSFLFFIYYKQNPNLKFLSLLIFITGFAVQVKTENIFLFGLFTLFTLFDNKLTIPKRKEYIFIFLIIIGLFISSFFFFDQFVNPAYRDGEGKLFSIDFFLRDIHWIDDEFVRFHFILLASMIIGFFSTIRDKQFWIIHSWVIGYSLFYLFEQHDDFQRYLVVLYIAFAFFMSIGLEKTYQLRNNYKFLILLAIIVTLMFFVHNNSQIYVGEQTEVGLAAKLIPDAKLFIVPTWNEVQVANFNSDIQTVHLDMLFSSSRWNQKIDQLLKNNQSVYYLELRCYGNLNCERLKDSFIMTNITLNQTLFEMKVYKITGRKIFI